MPGLYLPSQQSSTRKHWDRVYLSISLQPRVQPSSIVTAEGRWPPPPRHRRPLDRTHAMGIAKYGEMETWKTEWPVYSSWHNGMGTMTSSHVVARAGCGEQRRVWLSVQQPCTVNLRNWWKIGLISAANEQLNIIGPSSSSSGSSRPGGEGSRAEPEITFIFPSYFTWKYLFHQIALMEWMGIWTSLQKRRKNMKLY